MAMLAIATGLLSGLLGIGGNVLAIPGLLYIFKLAFKFSPDVAMHLTIGTCITVMVFTALASTLAHYNKKNISWSFYRRIAPFMIIGAVLGAISASKVNGLILEKIFGLFLLIISLQLFRSNNNPHSSTSVKQLPLAVSIMLGGVIGFKSGLLGIGGGTILIPLLLYLNYPARLVTGTTSVCSFTMAIVGALTFLLHGSSYNMGIPYSLGFIYLPALAVMVPFTFISAKIGASWSMQVSHTQLSKFLIFILLVLGLQMLF
ncbi:MAG: sulfite exporter TauE/SafE family protein, partial [Burkholderiales bacterium]